MFFFLIFLMLGVFYYQKRYSFWIQCRVLKGYQLRIKHYILCPFSAPQCKSVPFHFNGDIYHSTQSTQLLASLSFDIMAVNGDVMALSGHCPTYDIPCMLRRGVGNTNSRTPDNRVSSMGFQYPNLVKDVLHNISLIFSFTTCHMLNFPQVNMAYKIYLLPFVHCIIFSDTQVL